MSHALHLLLQIMIALLTLLALIWPSVFANGVDVDADDWDQAHIP